MKLWILEPRLMEEEQKNPWSPWYDKAFGFVVRAESEEKARELAADDKGSEEVEAWLDSNLSSCLQLISDGEEKVILRDFAAA